MSVHWPIIRNCVTFARRGLITDDQRTWKGAHVLGAALHIASVIEKRSESWTTGIMLPTGGAFPATALATWMLGRTAVPLNYLLGQDELQYVVDDSETDTIITVGPMLEHLGFTPRVKNLILLDQMKFTGIPEPRWPALASPDDLAVLLYTSGTSGKPKGVMLSHANISANVRQCVEWSGFTCDDVVAGVLPQFHSFGMTVLTLLPIAVGARVVNTARFMPTRILEIFRRERPTVFIGIPSMYNALVHAKSATPEDFASLKFIVSGGEPLPDDVYSRFLERFGKRINEGYGLTETSPVTNWLLPDEDKRHSVGRPIPGVRQRIVDPATGRVLGPGDEGEIRIDGPNIMQGYYKLPEQTNEAFDDEGWFRTGDIGRLCEDNYLYITGRLKEMIIVGGENVFPREIEEVLNKHPSVNASGVIGVSDPMRGELPWAWVEVCEGHEFDEKVLRSWCRENLAGYKVPREIRPIEELPRNPTGKIMRRQLHSLAEQPA